MSGSSTGSSTIHQLPNGTLEVLADGTKIQKTDDGVMLCVRPDGTKTQTTADGARLVVHADGSKVQTTSDGTKQEVATDGTITQTRPSGLVLIIWPDGRRRQTDTNGIIVDVAADGGRIQTNADGTKYEIRADGSSFTHLADGSIVEIDPKSRTVLRIVQAPPSALNTPSVNTASRAATALSRNPHIKNHFDQASGAWYEHNSQTGETRWLTPEEQEHANAAASADATEVAAATTMATTAISTEPDARATANERIAATEREAQQALRAMQAKVDASNEIVITLQRELKQAQQDRSQERHESERAIKQSRDAQAATISALQEELEQLKSIQHDRVKAESNDMAAKVMILKTDLFEVQANLKQEQTLRANAEADSVSTNGAIRAMAERLSGAKNEVSRVKAQLVDANKELRLLRGKYEDVVDQAGQVAEEVKTLKSLLDDSAKAYNASLADVARLEHLVAETTEKSSADMAASNQKKPLDAKMKAAEKMVAETIKRLQTSQKEALHTRSMLEEMQMRRESSEHLLRQQRSAISKLNVQVQELREELEKSAETYAKQARRVETDHRIVVTRLKNALGQLEEEFALVVQRSAEQKGYNRSHSERQAEQKLRADLDATKRLVETQGGQIFELEQTLMAKDDEVARIRRELSSLGKENATLQTKAKSRESVVTLEALKFFDMPSVVPLGISRDSHGNGSFFDTSQNGFDVDISACEVTKPKRPRLSDMGPGQSPVLTRMRSGSQSINGPRANELCRLASVEKERRQISLQSSLSSFDEADGK